jgi:hypothetical protein
MEAWQQVGDGAIAPLPWLYDRSGNDTATRGYSRVILDACLDGIRVLMMVASRT